MTAVAAHQSRAERIAALAFDYAAQSKQTFSTCNLCGANRFVVLVHRDRYGYPVTAHGCLTCGLVFLNPMMSGAAYGEFYDHVYRPLVSAYHGRLIDADTIQDEQRVYAAERADFLADLLDSSDAQTLLDVGGSTGVVAHHLASRFGLKAAVVDPSPQELERAARLGLETIAGFLEDLDAGERQFDVIIMCQTIDHLQDVAGSLTKVRQLLAPGGLFYVDIVDLYAAFLRNWSVEEAIKIDHPYYLTQSSIAAYLARTGFDIARMDYAADHLHIGYACRAAAPRPDYLPPRDQVEQQWRDLRYVQNAPRAS